jgi:hypothetical protein
MGVRSVQQLRQTVIELQLAPIRSSVHIPVATLWAHYTGGDVDAGLAELGEPARAMIDDLLWWTAASVPLTSSGSMKLTAPSKTQLRVAMPEWGCRGPL